MNKDEAYKKTVGLLNELFDVPTENINLSTKLYEDLDLDSIDAVDLIVHLRKMLQKEIDPELFKEARTIEDVVNIVISL